MMKIRLAEVELENKLKQIDETQQEKEFEMQALQKENKKLHTETIKQQNTIKYLREEKATLIQEKKQL